MFDHDSLRFAKPVLFKSHCEISEIFLWEGNYESGVDILIYHLFVVVCKILNSCFTSPKSPDKSLAVRSSNLYITNLSRICVCRRLIDNNKRTDYAFVHACLDCNQKLWIVTVLLHQG